MNLVSPVADLTCDIKKEVKQAALECMTAICNCTGNKDPRMGMGGMKWWFSSMEKLSLLGMYLYNCNVL